MSIIHQIRIYHASLAVLAILSYLSGDFGLVHAWLGYGVSMVIVLRLLWALGGNSQLGLRRFYPSFLGLNITNLFTHPAISKTLILGIALCLVMASATGIVIDRGNAVGLANVEVISEAYADEGHSASHKEDSLLSEVHEVFGNLLFLFIGAHAGYLLLFRRPLARFMLFLPKQPR